MFLVNSHEVGQLEGQVFAVRNLVLLYDLGGETLQIHIVYRIDHVVHFAALVEIGGRFVVDITGVQVGARI